jgi:hypothetical protein
MKRLIVVIILPRSYSHKYPTLFSHNQCNSRAFKCRLIEIIWHHLIPYNRNGIWWATWASLTVAAEVSATFRSLKLIGGSRVSTQRICSRNKQPRTLRRTATDVHIRKLTMFDDSDWGVFSSSADIYPSENTDRSRRSKAASVAQRKCTTLRCDLYVRKRWRRKFFQFFFLQHALRET